jgi:hypothetical protein
MAWMKNSLVAGGMLGAMMLLAHEARAAELPQEDRRIIEAVLEGLKGRKDLKFVREDKTYDARAAAWYMRYKWDKNKEKVNSVEDFVALESVGGKHGEVTYYVEFSDGIRKTAREVLEAAVKKLRGEATAKS